MAMKLQLKRELIHEHVQPTSNTLGAAFCLGPANRHPWPGHDSSTHYMWRAIPETAGDRLVCRTNIGVCPRHLALSSRCQVAGEERLLYCHFDICEEKDFVHNADIGPIRDLV